MRFSAEINCSQSGQHGDGKKTPPSNAQAPLTTHATAAQDNGEMQAHERPKWRTLLSLSAAEVRLLLEASVFVMGYDLGFALLPPRKLLEPSDTTGDVSRGEGGYELTPPRRSGGATERLAWAAEVADRTMPGKSSCLRRAAALARMLRRRGTETRLRLGVARRDGKLVAHAWLEATDGRLFGIDRLGQYAVLSASTPKHSSGNPVR